MHAHEAVSLLIFALGAFLIPLACGRIGVPAAVGEILFGVLFGPYALGWIGTSEYSTFLAELGFAFLMFLAGLELDFPRIERQGIGGLLTAVGVVMLLFGLALGVTLALQLPPFLFIAFGAVSLGILLVTLNEVHLTRSQAGQTLIFVASLGEFATIILLTVVGMYYQLGFGLHLGYEVAKLALIFLAAYVVLVVLRTLIWWWPRKFSRLVATHDPSEIGVRAAMAAMLVFVALAAMMGIESILGAFVAGALFAFVFREKRVLEGKMSSIGFGFFVPVFFIWVGTQFDLDAVMRFDVLPLLGTFLVASLGCKLLASLPLAASGLSWRQTLASGMLLATPLTLLVVIARIGLDVEIIDDATAGALVLLAIVTSVLLPWLFRLLMRSELGTAPHSGSAAEETNSPSSA